MNEPMQMPERYVYLREGMWAGVRAADGPRSVSPAELCRAIFDGARSAFGDGAVGPWALYTDAHERRWTREMCIASARGYATRTEWQKAVPPAYTAARENGWLEEATAHMGPTRNANKPGYWTKERCIESARPFKTRSAWLRGAKSAYNAARRKGWMDVCCKHMPKRALPRDRATTAQA